MTEQTEFLEARSAYNDASGEVEIAMRITENNTVEFALIRENAEIAVRFCRKRAEHFLKNSMDLLNVPVPPKPKRRWLFKSNESKTDEK